MSVGLNNAGLLNDWFPTNSGSSGSNSGSAMNNYGYTDQQLAGLDSTNVSNSNGYLNDWANLLGTATTGAAQILGASQNPAQDATPASGVQQPPGTNAANRAAGGGFHLTTTELVIGAAALGLAVWALA